MWEAAGRAHGGVSTGRGPAGTEPALGGTHLLGLGSHTVRGPPRSSGSQAVKLSPCACAFPSLPL